jgi:hypothetical protein
MEGYGWWPENRIFKWGESSNESDLWFCNVCFAMIVAPNIPYSFAEFDVGIVFFKI